MSVNPSTIEAIRLHGMSVLLKRRTSIKLGKFTGDRIY